MDWSGSLVAYNEVGVSYCQKSIKGVSYCQTSIDYCHLNLLYYHSRP